MIRFRFKENYAYVVSREDIPEGEIVSFSIMTLMAYIAAAGRTNRLRIKIEDLMRQYGDVISITEL